MGRMIVGQVLQFDPQYPQNTGGGDKGQIEEFGGAEGFGADPRFPPVAKSPVRHRQLLDIEHQSLADGEDFHLLSLRTGGWPLAPAGSR